MEKKKYAEYCLANNVPVFMQPWWLDATCGVNEWGVIYVEKNGNDLGFWPFYIRKKLGFSKITAPPLTKTMGPVINYPKDLKYTKKLAFEKEVMTLLEEKLPVVSHFAQNFSPEITNWLPLYWKAYNCTPYYTYRINNLDNLDLVFSEFRDNIRREIRKAQKKLIIKECDNIEEIYQLNELTFKRQGTPIPFTYDYFLALDTACKKNEQRKILQAYDEQNKLYSCLYLVWDNNYMYYLLGGSDPELLGSGASSLLMWEGIQLAQKMNLKFDFEGSMIEPIERFVRAFGAIQTPYFKIEKYNSKLLNVYERMLK